jgi:hypothetical protein
MIKPAVITVVQGTPEWDALTEALDQYNDNQQDYLDNHCEPGEDEDGRTNLKHARKIMDKIEAAHAALAEGPS